MTSAATNYQTNPRMDAGVHEIDPLTDPRWAAFVSADPAASVFHSAPWLEALHRTYAYQPVAYTTAPPGRPLQDALVLCRIGSWVTGRRLVSLPFSDHCRPLARNPEDLAVLLARAQAEADRTACRYLELRPFTAPPTDAAGLAPSASYCFHNLDLSPGLDTLFRAFHESCVQRKIRRAEREGLAYEEGQSPSLLARFYRLQVLTRRRQGLPPQPFAWFRNLAACLGPALKIRLLSRENAPIAGILTLSHNRTLVYKYGCSDARFHQLGVMPLLFWRAIQDAKAAGLLAFDLGRSDLDNEGLLHFKDRLGAERSGLTYWRSPASPSAPAGASWTMRAAKRVFASLPDPCRIAAGNLLYKHLG